MTIPVGDVPLTSASPSLGFRNPGALTRWLKFFMYLGFALGALSLLSGLLELKLLNDIQAGRPLAPGEAAGNDLRQRIIAGFRFVNFIVVIVLFCIWVYRANYNARQLGATNMRFTPGWAVGWYFIPFANLWKPYQAMREIWQASAAPSHWQQERYSGILPLWWTFFLLSNFFSNAAFRLSLRAKTVPDFILASSVTLASDAVDIVASVVALMVVTQIFQMQMARRAADAFA